MRMSTACALSVLLVCGRGAARADGPVTNARPIVAATTTIVGDVVAAVGGGDIDLRVLLPPGADAHAFEPAPRDIAGLAKARILFITGAGLETFVDRLTASLPRDARVVSVSEGIPLRAIASGDEHDGHAEGVDPHVWLDPNHVAVWARNISSALGAADPAHADLFGERAAAYIQRLQALDAWIREQVERVPPERRKIVADHQSFGYFAARYGFECLGSVTPAFSTLAEPFPREVASLQDRMRAQDIRVIFTGEGATPALCRRVAADTGARIVRLHVGALTPPGGDAPSYLEMMRFNVSALVKALEP
jgi:zinc/manganese transport system substrate-binding protein